MAATGVNGRELRFARQATPAASPAASPAIDLQPWEPRFTDDVTLRRFGFGTDNLTSEVRVAAFEEAYPNFMLEVTPEITDQKALTAVASGDVPDLFWLASNSIQTWAARGALEPLDEMIANDDRFDLSQFYQSEIDKVTYDGKIYAIPQFVDCRPLWLDHASLEESGLSPE